MLRCEMFPRPPHRVLAFLRRRLEEERGLTLVLSLGMMTALGLSGASLTYYATANSASATVSSETLRAEALAEAGVNNALSILHQAPNPRDPHAVPQAAETIDAGNVEWQGTYVDGTWTLVGRGTVRNPVGEPIVRRRTTKVSVTNGSKGTGNNAIWNYLYADSLSSCTTLSNSTVIDIPFYVRGNLCMSNSASVIGSHLQVGGTVTLTNTATIGSPGGPITEALVGGGCRIGNGPLSSPCSSLNRVYAETVGTAPTGLTKPPADLPGWYERADLGPRRNCSSGSFPGGFDNDAVLNGSRPTVNLMPTTAYDCRSTDANGNVVGQLTWTPGSPGTLVVKGTIFFDGNISLSGTAFGVYQGGATIYASGTISFSNSAKLCGSPGCDTAWNANRDLLAFVAGSSTASIGFSLANETAFQGAVYAVNDYQESNFAKMWGPVIARQLSISNNTQNHYVPFGTLLPGMPATYEEVTILSVVPGSYGE